MRTNEHPSMMCVGHVDLTLIRELGRKRWGVSSAFRVVKHQVTCPSVMSRRASEALWPILVPLLYLRIRCSSRGMNIRSCLASKALKRTLTELYVAKGKIDKAREGSECSVHQDVTGTLPTADSGDHMAVTPNNSSQKTRRTCC